MGLQPFLLPLKHYQSYSLTTRSRLAKMERLTEQCLQVLYSLVISSAVFLGLYGLFLVLPESQLKADCKATTSFTITTNTSNAYYLFYFYFTILLNMPLVFAFMRHTYITAFFIFKAVFLATYSWNVHLGEATRNLVINLNVSSFQLDVNRNRSVFSKRNSLNNVRFRRRRHLLNGWPRYLAEHSLVLVDLLHLNGDLVSWFLFWLFFALIGSNVFVTTLLLFNHFRPLVRLYLLVLLLWKFVSLYLISRLSALLQPLYAADRKLFVAQFSLNSRGSTHSGCLTLKLKLMAYYELVHSERTFSYTVGSYANLVNTWFWEV